MTKLTPQETVKAVLDALHSSSNDFVVETSGAPNAGFFCRRWDSGLQELIQRDIDASNSTVVTTFSIPFLAAPKVVLTPNNSQYNGTGRFSALNPWGITATCFQLERNKDQNMTIVFIAIGRWK